MFERDANLSDSGLCERYSASQVRFRCWLDAPRFAGVGTECCEYEGCLYMPQSKVVRGHRISIPGSRICPRGLAFGCRQ